MKPTIPLSSHTLLTLSSDSQGTNFNFFISIDSSPAVQPQNLKASFDYFISCIISMEGTARSKSSVLQNSLVISEVTKILAFVTLHLE